MRLERTSRVIWSNLPWQKHSVDKNPVQVNLKNVQCWGNHRCPEDIINMSNVSHYQTYRLEQSQEQTWILLLEQSSASQTLTVGTALLTDSF